MFRRTLFLFALADLPGDAITTDAPRNRDCQGSEVGSGLRIYAP
jgi:hypothetical protein